MACFLKLSLCLILSFDFCFASTGQALNQAIVNITSNLHNEFGCKFINSQYQISFPTSMPIWVERPKGRIFINCTPPDFKQLKPKVEQIGTISTIGNVSSKENQVDNSNIKDWVQFKDALRESFVNTLKTHTLNDLDPFIRFIEVYNEEMAKRKTILQKKMESFLNSYNYNVPYYSKENPVGLIIDLFHEMRKRNYTSPVPGRIPYYLEPYMEPYYLVTGYAESAESSKPFNANLTASRFQDHVAGVIQILYEGRFGYILVEPGYYYNQIVQSPFAVVLMEDANSPHGEFIFGRKLNDITFSMNGMYVWARNKDKKNSNHMVYNLEQSYCSFLETTTKGDLLRSEHGILTFDSNGAPVGHLLFNTKQVSFYLGVGEYDETSNVPLMHLIRSGDIQNDAMDTTQKAALDSYSSLLKSTPDQIISKMKNLTTEYSKTLALHIMKN